MSSELAVQHFLRSDSAQKRIEALVGERAGQFTATLMSVVNSNILLQQCTPISVLSAAITAAGLDLTVNPSLGQAYIIPYNNKKKDANGKTYFAMEATFQIGAKGFKQLALRSGSYKRINSTDVREGEYQGKDRLSGQHKWAWIEDDKEREKLPVIGYVNYFELRSGFESELFMTKDELLAHAKKYSKNFAKYGTGQWVDDFDGMARKTVMKLNISRNGITSVQLQQALLADQAVVDEDSYKYIDNEKDDKNVIDQTASSDNEAEGDQSKSEGSTNDGTDKQ